MPENQSDQYLNFNYSLDSQNSSSYQLDNIQDLEGTNNSQKIQSGNRKASSFFKGFISGILVVILLFTVMYIFIKEQIINNYINLVSKPDCSITYNQEFEKQNGIIIDDNRNIIVENIENDEDTFQINENRVKNNEKSIETNNDITFTATPKVYTYGQSIEFKVNNNSNKKITEYSRNFGEIDKHGNESMLLKSQYADSRHIYSSAGIYDVNLVAKYEDNTYSEYQDEVFMGDLVGPIAAFNIKDSRGNKLIRSSYCFSSDEQDVMVGFYPAYTVNRNQEIIIDPSISINEKGTSKGLQYVFEDESIDGNYQKVKVLNQLEKSFSETGCHYEDLTVKDTNVGKQDKVRIWFDVE